PNEREKNSCFFEMPSIALDLETVEPKDRSTHERSEMRGGSPGFRGALTGPDLNPPLRIARRSIRATRLKAADKPLDVAADETPIVEPVARESRHDVGCPNPAAKDASARRSAHGSGTADQEVSRRCGIVNQILAL